MKKLYNILSVAVIVSVLIVMIGFMSRTYEENENDISFETAYAQAVALGFEGSFDDYISAVQAERGESAFEIAVRYGFEGNEEEWLLSLQGQDGLSAYDIAVVMGFEGSLADWLQSLQGDDGDNGLSAYDIAVNHGFEGSEEDWVQALQGSEGSQLNFSDIISQNNLLHSVVTLESQNEEGSSLYSGVIISKDGYILTNAHGLIYEYPEEGNEEVLYDTFKAMFRDDETEYEIEVVDYDLSKDLAIVKFSTAVHNLNAVEIDSAHYQNIGDNAIIIGNAAGLGITASAGIISETPQLYDVSYMDDICEAIRTDSAVNPGNSGGGLFNDKGKLIGIVTFKLSVPYESLGFALTTDFAIEYIDNVQEQLDIEINYIQA